MCNTYFLSECQWREQEKKTKERQTLMRRPMTTPLPWIRGRQNLCINQAEEWLSFFKKCKYLWISVNFMYNVGCCSCNCQLHRLENMELFVLHTFWIYSSADSFGESVTSHDTSYINLISDQDLSLKLYHIQGDSVFLTLSRSCVRSQKFSF